MAEQTGESRDIDENNPDDLRQLGNHQFSNGNYDIAATFYTRALELVGETFVATDESSTPPTSLLLNLCNRSACFFQMEHYEEARKDAEMAWNYLPQLSNIKAAYRLAKTLIAEEKFDEGKGIIMQVFQVLEEVEVEERKEAERESMAKRRADPRADPREEKKEVKPEDSAVATQKKAFNDLLKTLEKKQKNQGKEPPKLSIRDFEMQDELGFGNFSEIYKVQHKKTGKQFALKRINKKKAADLG